MNNFSVVHKVDQHVHVLHLSGELDAHTASQLEDALQERIAAQDYRLVVNFADLSYIASAGLGVFMAYIEDVREAGGDIKLCCMTDSVYDVFDLLGFPALYDVFDGQQKAIAAYQNSEEAKP